MEENLPLESVDRLITRFTVPLQGAGANCDKIKEEMLSLLQYAVHFRPYDNGPTSDILRTNRPKLMSCHSFACLDIYSIQWLHNHQECSYER